MYSLSILNNSGFNQVKSGFPMDELYHSVEQITLAIQEQFSLMQVCRIIEGPKINFYDYFAASYCSNEGHEILDQFSLRNLFLNEVVRILFENNHISSYINQSASRLNTIRSSLGVEAEEDYRYFVNEVSESLKAAATEHLPILANDLLTILINQFKGLKLDEEKEYFLITSICLNINAFGYEVLAQYMYETYVSKCSINAVKTNPSLEFALACIGISAFIVYPNEMVFPFSEVEREEMVLRNHRYAYVNIPLESIPDLATLLQYFLRHSLDNKYIAAWETLALFLAPDCDRFEPNNNIDIDIQLCNRSWKWMQDIKKEGFSLLFDGNEEQKTIGYFFLAIAYSFKQDKPLQSTLWSNLPPFLNCQAVKSHPVLVAYIAHVLSKGFSTEDRKIVHSLIQDLLISNPVSIELWIGALLNTHSKPFADLSYEWIKERQDMDPDFIDRAIRTLASAYPHLAISLLGQTTCSANPNTILAILATYTTETSAKCPLKFINAFFSKVCSDYVHHQEVAEKFFELEPKLTSPDEKQWFQRVIASAWSSRGNLSRPHQCKSWEANINAALASGNLYYAFILWQNVEGLFDDQFLESPERAAIYYTLVNRLARRATPSSIQAVGELLKQSNPVKLKDHPNTIAKLTFQMMSVDLDHANWGSAISRLVMLCETDLLTPDVVVRTLNIVMAAQNDENIEIILSSLNSALCSPQVLHKLSLRPKNCLKLLFDMNAMAKNCKNVEFRKIIDTTVVSNLLSTIEEPLAPLFGEFYDSVNKMGYPTLMERLLQCLLSYEQGDLLIKLIKVLEKSNSAKEGSWLTGIQSFANKLIKLEKCPDDLLMVLNKNLYAIFQSKAPQINYTCVISFVSYLFRQSDKKDDADLWLKALTNYPSASKKELLKTAGASVELLIEQLITSNPKWAFDLLKHFHSAYDSLSLANAYLSIARAGLEREEFTLSLEAYQISLSKHDKAQVKGYAQKDFLKDWVSLITQYLEKVPIIDNRLISLISENFDQILPQSNLEQVCYLLLQIIKQHKGADLDEKLFSSFMVTLQKIFGEKGVTQSTAQNFCEGFQTIQALLQCPNKLLTLISHGHKVLYVHKIAKLDGTNLFIQWLELGAKHAGDDPAYQQKMIAQIKVQAREMDKQVMRSIIKALAAYQNVTIFLVLTELLNVLHKTSSKPKDIAEEQLVWIDSFKAIYTSSLADQLQAAFVTHCHAAIKFKNGVFFRVMSDFLIKTVGREQRLLNHIFDSWLSWITSMHNKTARDEEIDALFRCLSDNYESIKPSSKALINPVLQNIMNNQTLLTPELEVANGIVIRKFNEKRAQFLSKYTDDALVILEREIDFSRSDAIKKRNESFINSFLENLECLQHNHQGIEAFIFFMIMESFHSENDSDLYTWLRSFYKSILVFTPSNTQMSVQAYFRALSRYFHRPMAFTNDTLSSLSMDILSRFQSAVLKCDSVDRVHLKQSVAMLSENDKFSEDVKIAVGYFCQQANKLMEEKSEKSEEQIPRTEIPLVVSSDGSSIIAVSQTGNAQAVVAQQPSVVTPTPLYSIEIQKTFIQRVADLSHQMSLEQLEKILKAMVNQVFQSKIGDKIITIEESIDNYMDLIKAVKERTKGFSQEDSDKIAVTCLQLHLKAAAAIDRAANRFSNQIMKNQYKSIDKILQAIEFFRHETRDCNYRVNLVTLLGLRLYLCYLTVYDLNLRHVVRKSLNKTELDDRLKDVRIFYTQYFENFIRCKKEGSEKTTLDKNIKSFYANFNNFLGTFKRYNKLTIKYNFKDDLEVWQNLKEELKDEPELLYCVNYLIQIAKKK